MEIAPTSYLRVNGASIVDDSGTRRAAARAIALAAG